MVLDTGSCIYLPRKESIKVQVIVRELAMYVYDQEKTAPCSLATNQSCMKRKTKKKPPASSSHPRFIPSLIILCSMLCAVLYCTVLCCTVCKIAMCSSFRIWVNVKCNLHGNMRLVGVVLVAVFVAIVVVVVVVVIGSVGGIRGGRCGCGCG